MTPLKRFQSLTSTFLILVVLLATGSVRADNVEAPLADTPTAEASITEASISDAPIVETSEVEAPEVEEGSALEKALTAPIKKLIEPQPVVVVDVSLADEQELPEVLDGKVSEKPEQVPQLAKAVMGWLEFVILPDIDPQQKFKAKLDTGAKTSSLNGRVIENFERDGREWVRFEFFWHLKKSEDVGPLVVEAPVKDGIKIKHHHTKSRLRYTVIIPMKLGDTIYYPEFSLADRSDFNYPVLLGREFLKQLAIVDPSEIFLVTTSHQKKKEPDADQVATTQPVK